MSVRVYVHVYVYVYAYACVCVRVSVCICVHVRACTLHREVLLEADPGEAPGVSAAGPDPALLEGPACQPRRPGRRIRETRGPQDRLLKRYTHTHTHNHTLMSRGEKYRTIILNHHTYLDEIVHK